jgi:hypothetical protein
VKKFYSLLLAAVLLLTAAYAAMAEDAKQGPEIYVDWGLGGTDNFDEGDCQLKKTEFGQMIIGAEYPLSRWNFGVEYAWANDYKMEDSLTGYTDKGDSSLMLLKACYQVMNLKQCQLYVDGVYAQDTFVDKFTGTSTGKTTWDTKGLLIGPEVRYTFNDKLKVQGFFGYGVHVAQTETDEYSGNTYKYNADDESMTFLNVKLIYSFRDNWAAAMGYRAKEIKSEANGYKYSDKKDMLTVGAVYKF